MSLHIACPECKAAYTLPDSQAGKTLRCKFCQSAFIAPSVLEESGVGESSSIDESGERLQSASGSSSTAAVAERRERPRRKVGNQRSRRKASKSGNVKGLVLIIGGSAALSLVLLVLVLTLIWSRRQSADLAAPIAVHTPNPYHKAEAEAAIEVQKSVKAAREAVKTAVAHATGKPPPDVSTDPQARQVGLGNWTDVISGGTVNRVAPEVLAKVKRATVFIQIVLSDGRQQAGTGFFGAPGLDTIILTNAHVLGMLAPESPPPRDIRITLNSGERDRKDTGARVLAVDRHSDLAVLEIKAIPGLPTPLKVKPAAGLRELDQVFVYGFPLGKRLGEEITVRQTQISSFRKKNGRLEKIQVQGGMDPGNSGGPVVDAEGDVIGVAVSGYEGRLINFAIPGDRIAGILEGKASDISLGQPFVDGNKVGVPVSVELIDPRRLVQSAGVEIWTGNRTDPLPPTTSAPAVRPGETEHLRVELPIAGNMAQGEITLPDLPPGKVYWLQPVYKVNNVNHWGPGTIQNIKRELAVERKPANLLLRPQSANREVALSLINTFRASNDEEGELAVLKTNIDFLETITTTAGTPGVNVRLAYRRAKRDLIQNKQPPQPSLVLTAIEPYLDRLIAVMTFDEHGNMTQNSVDRQWLMSISGPPPSAQANKNQRPKLSPAAAEALVPVMQQMLDFHVPAQSALDLLSVTMPNKDNVKPGESWRAPFPKTLPIDAPGKYDGGLLDLTYTYLGQRQRGGQIEAVISINGLVRGKEGAENVTGAATGTALVNLTTGMITLVEIRSTVDILGSFGESENASKMLGILEARLERSTVN